VELDRRVRGDARFAPLAAGGPELDIVVWGVRAGTVEEASRRAQETFVACAARDLHLALVQLPQSWMERAVRHESTEWSMSCLRSVLMKPEHLGWLDTIWEKLTASCAPSGRG
jgi:hypothetical protein